MNTRLKQVFWIALVIKLAIAATIPLTNDEAYYWVWSKHMQLSFYDHPPFVAWLFWLGDQLGATHLIRWPAIVLGHGTLWLWLRILRPVLSEEQRLYWLLLALFSPLIGGTNLLVTPDLPLLFFYALSLWIFYHWKDSPDWLNSSLFGLALGLGFTSKYMIVLLPMSLAPLFIFTPELRRSLLRSLLWLTLGFLLGALPVWLWNLRNDFASFAYQADHGLGGHRYKPSWTLEYVLVQLGIIFPIILYWALRARQRLPVIFHLLAWVPLGFFLITTHQAYVEANWPIVAYPPLLALACASLPRNIRGVQLTLTIWATLMTALYVIILVHPSWSRDMKLKEFTQYDNLIEPARTLTPLYAKSYQMAAKLSFEIGRPIYKLRGMNRKDFYDYLPESEPKEHQFYLATEKGDYLPASYRNRGFKILSSRDIDDQISIWTVQAP